MTARLPVITVGAGYFASFHHEAWQRHPETELVAVVDTDLERAQAVGVPAFASLTDAAKSHPAAILDLVIPPTAHAALIDEALGLRPDVIICQKPFGTDITQAAALRDRAETAGIPLIIHENFRFQPWYRVIKSAIDNGDLGDVHQATFRLRTGDGRGPEAYLARQPYFQTMPRLLIHETAVHWVDTFRYLFGRIRGVYADLRRMNPVIAGEDAGHVLFEFDHDIRALFDGNRHLDHATKNPRLTFGEGLFEGTKAMISLFGDGSVTRRAYGSQTSETLLEARQWPGFAGDCVYALQAHVIDALQRRGEFENTARDYLAVREVEEAIYTSHDEKRRISM